MQSPKNKIKKRKEVRKMKKFKKRTLVVCLITALILPSLQISLSAHAETINEDNENKTDDVMEHLQRSRMERLPMTRIR